ncbi:MAG: tetratricopeptide repeat protein [Nitrospiria bacterium]
MIRLVFVLVLTSLGFGCARLLPVSPPSSDASSAAPSHSSSNRSAPAPSRIAPAVAYGHFIQGYLFELRNQPDQALIEYRTALEIDPGSIVLRHHAASLAFQRGQYDLGVEYAEEVLRRDSDHVPSLFLLARWYAGTPNGAGRALGLFERIVALEPDQAEPYLNLGLLYARLERYADAERMINRAIAIAPNSPLARLYLGKVAADQKRWKHAAAHFEKAIELAPFFEHAYIALGDLYVQQGDRKRAVEVYRRLLKKVDPRDSEVVGRLVNLYLEERTFDQALALLEELLRGDPQNVEARLLRGRIYGEMGKPVDAIHELEQVVAAKPSDTVARYYLGRLYDEQQQPEKAIAQFEQIVARDGDVVEAYLQLGLLYARTKRFTEAESVAEQAKAKAPERPEAYLVLGFIHSQQGRYERAVELYRAALIQHPDHPTLHFNLGLAYDKLKQFDLFVKALEEAIRLDPKYSEALNYLGYTYAEKDMKLKEAVELIRRALAVKPDDGAYVDSLGWAHYKLGQWDEAVRELEKAVALMPDDAVIYEHLGDAYLKKKREGDAREAWLKSLELDPTNKVLIERFKGAGFGDPEIEERIQRSRAKKEGKPAAVNHNLSDVHSDPGT